MLARWVQRFVTDYRWLVEHRGPHCEIVILLGPMLSMKIFGSWLLVDIETEFEHLNDVIYCPRVADALINLTPYPPDEIFDKSDRDFFVDPFDMP